MDSLKDYDMITTWLSDAEIKAYSSVTDKELNDLFQEIRQKSRNKFLLQEVLWSDRPPFWQTARAPITYYSLYALNGMEAQVINFALDHEWSINTSVRKSHIMAFFYGILAGLQLKEPITEKV